MTPATGPARAGFNFARDVVEARDPASCALIELARDGSRREHSFGDIARRSAALGGRLQALGVERGDVVMTLIGNRPEWLLAMVACFRIGAVVLPCTEQLRAKDLRHRLEVADPRVVIADPRNRTTLEAAIGSGDSITILGIDDPSLWTGTPARAVDLALDDACLITFTSGTSGTPKAAVHAQRYLAGQALQATHWLAAAPGDVVWCTASSGWSKSARNAFIAPWLRGSTALLHDARFDPDERLSIIERERVAVLCMAPTEYRMMAAQGALRPLPHVRGMVSAGEALTSEVLLAWREATGSDIRDGYGQTETGQLTGWPPGMAVAPGSMGPPLPGIRLWVQDGELLVDPGTVPTFFRGYLNEGPITGPWRTGDRVREQDGRLYFEARVDDVIVSSGYRIGPAEVESALVSHGAVADAVVVAAPDHERGSIVHAYVVLGPGHEPSDALATRLQDHVKAETAPYKYPRRVTFITELPRTPSGKVRRAALRAQSTV